MATENCIILNIVPVYKSLASD